MYRSQLLTLLNEYQPSLEEIDSKERLINFIKNNSNCFERTLKEGHITGSAWLVNKNKDKALLLHHRKLNIWVQPGGHADGNSDVLQVALNEAKEESGIDNIKAIKEEIFDIDIHLIPASVKEETHFHYDIRFLLQVEGDEQVKMNSESKNFMWIDKNNPQYNGDDRSVVRLIEKWQKL